MIPASKNKSVWFVYIASLLTPFTGLLSGLLASSMLVIGWIKTKMARWRIPIITD